jgi:hypothetical protein
MIERKNERRKKKWKRKKSYYGYFTFLYRLYK